MSTLEQVEKLKEKANVSYEEAKAALDAAGDDMLDAIIHLEKQGKVNAPANNGKFSTTSAKEDTDEEKKKKKKEKEKEKEKEYGETFSSIMGRLVRWCGRIIAKGNVHMFEVRRNGEVLVSIPLTVLILLLIFAFWVVIPLIVIGLFFGCRYYFRGPDLEKTGVNKMMDAAANAAEDLKKEIKESDN